VFAIPECDVPFVFLSFLLPPFLLAAFFCFIGTSEVILMSMWSASVRRTSRSARPQLCHLRGLDESESENRDHVSLDTLRYLLVSGSFQMSANFVTICICLRSLIPLVILASSHGGFCFGIFAMARVVAVFHASQALPSGADRVCILALYF
jgi:hypothetical protein